MSTIQICSEQQNNTCFLPSGQQFQKFISTPDIPTVDTIITANVNYTDKADENINNKDDNESLISHNLGESNISMDENKSDNCELVTHPLFSGWTYYYRPNKPEIKTDANTHVPDTDWSKEIQTINVIETVEGFWQTLNFVQLPSKINHRASPNFMWFRDNIHPSWESPDNENGGMWRIVLQKAHRHTVLDKSWLETLIACIGEQFTHGDYINGVVLQRRQKEDRLQLWTRDASNHAVQKLIGVEWREFLNFSTAIPMEYVTHEDLEKDNNSRSISPRSPTSKVITRDFSHEGRQLRRDGFGDNFSTPKTKSKNMSLDANNNRKSSRRNSDSSSRGTSRETKHSKDGSAKFDFNRSSSYRIDDMAKYRI